MILLYYSEREEIIINYTSWSLARYSLNWAACLPISNRPAVDMQSTISHIKEQQSVVLEYTNSPIYLWVLRILSWRR